MLTGLAAMVVYVRTASPAVSIIDSGELAAVACTLGIAHPTGYPLFTLLGRIAAMLPGASEAIVRLNLMAAFFTAASVGVLCHLLSALLRMPGLRGAKEGRGRSAAVQAAAVGGALIFAFTGTVWAQAVAVEVYSLHLLMMMLVLRVALHAWEARQAGDDRELSRAWYVGAFLLGLSFGNHMTTVLLLPALLVIFLATAGVTRFGRTLALRSALWGAGGLSIYLYLPLRAAQHPLFSWGDVTSLEHLFWHVSGKQYRVWIFSSWDVAQQQLLNFLHGLPGEFTVAGLLLALVGLVLFLRRALRPALVSVLLAVSCVGYAINYDIHDIDAYFLTAYLVIAVWASVALAALLRWIPQRLPGLLLWVGTLVVPAVMLSGTYASADRSRDYMVEDYTRAVFAAVDSGGVVLSYQWDFWLSASYYYQHVEGWRRDVTVVDKELLRRSWYLTELERRYPELMGRVRPEVEAFRKELDKFEHDLPYNSAVIQARFVSMIGALLRTALERGPVYVTLEIEPEFTAGYQRVPVGPLLRLYADTLFHPSARPVFAHRPMVRDDDYAGRLRLLYAEAWAARGRYYLAHGDQAEAEESFREASPWRPAAGQIPPK